MEIHVKIIYDSSHKDFFAALSFITLEYAITPHVSDIAFIVIAMNAEIKKAESRYSNKSASFRIYSSLDSALIVSYVNSME